MKAAIDHGCLNVHLVDFSSILFFADRCFWHHLDESFIVNLKSRRSIALGIALSSALLVSACGGADTSGLEKKVRVEQQAPDTESEEVTPDDPESLEDPLDDPLDDPETPGDDAQDDPANTPSAGDYKNPTWAYPVTEPGELLQGYKNEWFEYQVYQVDTGEATKDSMWSLPDTGEPVMKKGDPVVAVNIIATNISDEVIPLSISFINASVDYESNDYYGGAMIDFNPEWFEELGINDSPMAEFQTPAVFPLVPGESISFGQIYEYRAGEEAEIEFDFTPVDDSGNLDFESEMKHRESANFKFY